MNALDDVRIISLGQHHQAPMSTLFLAAMGADVIKVEPLWGDQLRFFNPLIKGKAGMLSPYFAYLNRNQRGITLDLKKEKGKKIFKELTKIGDVVVENFSPGTMDDLGLGYEALKQVNPKIIYISQSGFGQTGPYSSRLSFSPIAEAASGSMDLLRNKENFMNNINGRPISQPEPIADTIPALFSVISILSALYYRNRTGHGQKIDLAQADCMIAVTSSFAFHAMANTVFSGAMREAEAIPETYQTKDGYVIATAPRGMEERLAKLFGIEVEKLQSGDRLVRFKIIDEWIKDRTREEVVKAFNEARLPVAPVNSLEDVIKDPHFTAREMFVETDLANWGLGKTKMPNFPIKFSETKAVPLDKAPPLLGQHNDEVFSTLLGYSKEEIAKLREERVI